MAESVLAWDVDWVNFQDEYPNIDGDAKAWTWRLALALGAAWNAERAGGCPD
ncbi:hypothetical protein [Actinokineospora sp.]|uniref:hypothetical protein n=1 Tax=Actinokineospora sp. TaxID=1872133 RepID=UPI003D6AD4C4